MVFIWQRMPTVQDEPVLQKAPISPFVIASIETTTPQATAGPHAVI